MERPSNFSAESWDNFDEDEKRFILRHNVMWDEFTRILQTGQWDHGADRIFKVLLEEANQ